MIFAPFSFDNFTVSDVDAQNFINVAGITNPTQKIAINTLVTDLKTNSLWDLMFLVYPFVGGTSTTTKYNLKNPTQYTITWNGGVTFNNNGVTGNGSTGYGQTGWIPSTVNASTGITTSLSASVYSRTSSSNDGEEMGVAVGQPAIQVLCRRASGLAIWDNYNSTSGRVSGAVTNSQGLFTTSRTAQNSMKGFRNSTQFGTTNTTNATTTDISSTLNKEMYVLAQNNNGTAASYSSRNLAFMHIGKGLTDSEVSTLYTIVQNFQTVLGRQV